MLVLSRKANEKIQIGDGITVTVLRIKGNQIKLGIDAPRDVRVVRSELPPRTLAVAEAAADVPVEGALIDLSELAEVFATTVDANVEGESPRRSQPYRNRMQTVFEPATTPQWSSTPRRPGSAPLGTRVAGAMNSRLGAQL